jgi:drug/metabolite transporter (DMT)-like permease
MKNWRALLGGAIGSLGLILATLPNAIEHTAGLFLAALGQFIMGTQVKDKQVTGGTIAQTTEAQKRV